MFLLPMSECEYTLQKPIILYIRFWTEVLYITHEMCHLDTFRPILASFSTFSKNPNIYRSFAIIVWYLFDL